MTEFRLTSFVSPASDLPSFAIPVFERLGRLFVQNIGDQGEIKEFQEVSEGRFQFWHESKSIVERRLGDPSIWCFLTKQEAIVGGRSEVEDRLRDILPNLKVHPFVYIEALNFLDQFEDLPVAIVGAAATMISINEDAAVEWALLEQKGSQNYVLSELTEIRAKRRAKKNEKAGLGSVFTAQQPLGPVVFPDRAMTPFDESALFTGLAIYKELASGANKIIGRRGSGKTAALYHLSSNDPSDCAINIKIDRAFAFVTGVISRLNGPLYVEQVAALWRYIIWLEIAEKILENDERKFDQNILDKTDLEALVSGVASGMTLDEEVSPYPLRISSRFSTVQSEGDLWEALKLTDDLAQSILKATKSLNFKVRVSIDSLETYPFENEGFRNALAGLLKFSGSFSNDHPEARLAMAIPESHLEDFREASSNPIKDFSGSFLLRWRSIDLIRLSLWRLSHFFRINNEPRYLWLADKISGSREEIRAAWYDLFPRTVLNRSGREEESLAYVLRHTEMTPRHVLSILNEACSFEASRTQEMFPISEKRIRHAVLSSTGLFADSAASEYKDRFPRFAEYLSRVLPNLPIVFSQSDLHRAFNRYGRALDREFDFHSFVGMLSEVGVLGRLLEEGRRYHKADFSFLSRRRFALSANDVYCVHPIYSETFQINSKTSGVVVLPASEDDDASLIPGL
jgi:hypothetical protein